MMMELKDIHKFWISFGLMVTAIILITNNAMFLLDYPEFALGWVLVVIISVLLFMYLKWTVKFYRRIKFGIKADWN